jgi:hypothetical protein
MLDGSCTNFERLHCIEVHQEAIVSKSIDYFMTTEENMLNGSMWMAQ